MNIYENVLSIAKEAHKGQKDKAGRDYIEHLIFVADLVNSEEEKAVALLHDIVEDTAMTLEELIGLGIPAKIVEAVSILTKEPKLSYFSYIETVKTNQLAKVVKLADLTHNSDLSRIPNPTERDYKRTRKYQRAIRFLKDTEYISFQKYDNSLK